MRYLVLSFGFIFLCIACKKVEVNSYDYPDFLGYWIGISEKGDTTTLDINSVTSYYGVTGNTNKSGTGSAVVIPSKNVLKIGNEKFHIDSYPIEVITHWEMTLDGVLFVSY